MNGHKMEIEVDLRFSNGAQAGLKKPVRESIGRYFQHVPTNSLGLLRFVGVKVDSSGNADCLIKPSLGLQNPGQLKGVPVSVWVEGRQGVRGFLSCKDENQQPILQALIAEGRQKKPPKVLDDVHLRPDAAADSMSPPAETPVVQAEVVVEKPLVQESFVVRPTYSADSALSIVVSPRRKLEEAGYPEEDIERLKATLASILVRTHASTEEIPNSLRVPVKVITQAILEHMKLPYSSLGNHQGTIGSFYSAKIALFGLKYDYGDKIDPTERYSDWLLDCSLIMDFIGGVDKLSHLVRERDQEVAARVTQEQQPKVEAPTAETITELVDGGFAADAQLLDAVAKMMVGAKEASEALMAAIVNENALELEVNRLEEILRGALRNLEQAAEFRKQAELRLKEFTLTEDVRAKIVIVRDRFNNLMQSIGI